MVVKPAEFEQRDLPADEIREDVREREYITMRFSKGGTELKIAIDFRSIPATGIWNYSSHLAAGLRDKGVDILPFELPDELKCGHGVRRLVWENTTLARMMEKESVDLFHCTNNYGIPLRLSCRSVLTVHDFIPLTLEDVYLPQFKKRMAYRTFLSHSIRAASRIITISDFTHGELIRRFPTAAGKARRVYLGCGAQYKRVDDSRTMAKTVEKLGLPDEFVLTMGGTEPRKNVARIVDIFRERWTNGDKWPTLAIVGDCWRGCGTESWQLTPNIVYLGKVEADELIHLYNQCLLFVFPSLLEGFGLPVLEAMGCGAPVLAMRASSIPEVAGDAAILADPNPEKALAVELERLLADAPLRRELTARGHVQASRFSWETTVAETRAVYDEALTAG